MAKRRWDTATTGVKNQDSIYGSLLGSIVNSKQEP